MTQRINLPMPFGWFQVVFSNEIEAGKSKGIRYFGEELVLFRTGGSKSWSQSIGGRYSARPRTT